jgi:hypothetical protein
VREPYHLSVEEIGNLTPYQVKNLYFRPKEADEPVGEYLEEKDLFWKVHKEWKGMEEEEVAALWAKQQNIKQE